MPPFSPRDVLTQNGQQVITIGDARVMTVTREMSRMRSRSHANRPFCAAGNRSRAVADARAARANPLAGTGILIRNSFLDLVASFVKWLPRMAGALLLSGDFLGSGACSGAG